MDKRLNDILEYYEEEKRTLRQLSDEYVSDRDYFNAHIISKQIFNIERKLERFYILSDDLYDEKIRLESINTLENFIKAHPWDYMREYRS